MQAAATIETILSVPDVIQGLVRAWFDSQPGTAAAHEEGGFVVRSLDEQLAVVRWPEGEQNTIVLPDHTGCAFNGLDIVLSFHTHPNTGPDFLQEPSGTDIRAVKEDPDLKGDFYVGELVISAVAVYHIAPDGIITVLPPLVR